MIFSSLKTVTKRLSLVVTVLLFTFFTVSCQNPAQGNYGEIIGTWTSTYGEIFVIRDTTLGNFFQDSNQIKVTITECYSGNNLHIIPENDKSGYLYFTYGLVFDRADVGKWYAVHYKNLTPNSVSLSAAAKEGGKSSTESLSDAITEFTVENGYFSWYSECSK